MVDCLDQDRNTLEEADIQYKIIRTILHFLVTHHKFSHVVNLAVNRPNHSVYFNCPARNVQDSIQGPIRRGWFSSKKRTVFFYA